MVSFLICLFSACEKNPAEQISARFENSKDLSSYSKIEDVDFKNFSYSLDKNKDNGFTLTNGEKPYGQMEDITFRLRNVQYTDLTDDNKNEAIINIFVGYGGSGTTSLIYIYTLKNQQPKKLWEINSGYNANGGLKEIYSKGNNLIVEFFSDTKFDENNYEFIFPNIQKYPRAECCPNNFTKFEFKWSGEKFILNEKPELLNYNWKNQTNENLFYRKQS